ncbi:MAG: hypothetical protein ACRDQ7_19140 [Haloechinothrix sp.]
MNIQVDVIVLGVPDGGAPRRLLSVGEAKWREVMNLGHMARLQQASDHLHRKGLDTRDTIFALYGGAGFDADLRSAAARDPLLLLVDLQTLYGD